MKHIHFISLVAIVSLAASLRADEPAPAAPADIEFFEKRIRPAFIENCYDCHGPEADEPGGGLRLDSRAGWQAGGISGPAIVPGKPEESLLIKAIRRQEKDSAMPPETALPASVVNDFLAWIAAGAVDPREGAVITASTTTKSVFDIAAERKKWAFHAPELPAIPQVKNADWVKNDVDRFILARLEAASLKPAPPLEAAPLARRLHFDLTGLPPTPAEVDQFVAEASENRDRAIAALVDRLLESPHYGEKWGRHWLDLVRYADSLDARGMGQPGDILDAWRYRDWVVNAFNRDLSYDEFIRQQVAGDLLAAQEWDSQKVTATGMYAIGNWGNGDSDKQKVHSDIVDDQIDVTSRAFLGLTLACARCHDHKFDPLSTADYYSLAGFFYSSRILEKFNAPTAGESLMRIKLFSPEEQTKRDQLLAQIAAIDAKLSGGLRPFTKRRDNVAEQAGLVGWTIESADNPSLVINTTSEVAKFVTITLPTKAVCVHPGPQEVVTAVWQSPVAGKVLVSARVHDADANCGNGFQWAVRHGGKELAGGTVENARGAEAVGVEVDVKAGELIRLSIAPRGEYSCDSTQIDFVIREAAEGSRVWDLRASLAEPPHALDLAKTAFTVCAGDGEQFANQRPDKEPLLAERNRLNSQLPELNRCQGLQEGGIPGTPYEGFQDARIHVRGRYDRLSETRPRGFPAVLSDSQSPAIEGSGRLALAEWLASPTNPLTARVMANRLWQHHFGAGIVRTSNNFGKLGEPPTHPELLDWLACMFVESGWRVKSMHRLICTSAAYQQDSRVETATLEADPDNRLFSRQNRRKLTAEELRDSLLSSAGTLNRELGGPSTNDPKSNRRTLYLTTVRSDRTSYQMLFDGADPTSIVERRTDSVVAPQALWLLNQPFAMDQAKNLAERLSREAPADTTGRLNWLSRQLFAREPSTAEVQLGTAALQSFGDGPQGWERLCHALVCSNEFLFVD